MLSFSADIFYTIGILLEMLIQGQQRGYLVPEDAMKWFNQIENHCKSLNLKVSIHALDASRRSLAGDTGIGLRDSLQVLQNTIRWEMQETAFFYIPQGRATKYEQLEPFGSQVADNFRDATFDLTEAGNCFACARFTACVFHLMRGLEIGLTAFAREFPNVKTDHTNWQKILDEIEARIRDMAKDPNRASDWKVKHEAYSQAASTFVFFKDAWRNYTAHARGKYLESEADTIFRNVGLFMAKLAQMGFRSTSLTPGP